LSGDVYEGVLRQTDMNNRVRYLSAICVNVLFPWLAYRLAYPHWGYLGALAASTLPLIAWMTWDYLRLNHFDALSALVLVGTSGSLAVSSIVDNPRTRLFETPIISGLIGIAFLISLAFSRPLVYYLGRSTLSRERDGGSVQFEQRWRNDPFFAAIIRKMTLVWGLWLTAEDALRVLLDVQWEGAPWLGNAAYFLQYATYAGLSVWTYFKRKQLKQPNPGLPVD
jgi:hypothetical protein